ncbi:uncharacterized protein LOC126335038 [Schistocerca gregaria]|uniref:uncharacterized protein LOC126335038 n=1 Tax=Schistocerca gregaria TaxID=7010 RepID=UPI00211DD621|nr:uncharacterized protein LOC126335038 [Schistocerca gregaria]
MVDASGAKVGVAWLEPARRALRKIPGSSLPQGKWHAEIRPLRCVPEIQQLTVVPDQNNNKKSKSHHHLSLAAIRAIMNVVHLWLADFGFPPEEIISLGIFSDGTHNLPKGLVFSQPAMLDCNGFWSPCETVLPPSEGPVHLADILPIPLRATASFGLGKCMRAIWTLPMSERESEQEKEKAAVERISKEEEKIKEWLEMYTLLDEYEKKISAEIERKAISTEAKYRWLSLSERLPEDKV